MKTANEQTSIENLPERSILRAVKRGFGQKCPNCGNGSLFEKYLKVEPHCKSCGEALHHHRADDAPPYFTIFIVGHILVPILMAVEIMYRPSLWLHVALWLPITVAMCYWLLPKVKGALVGLQWAMYMHGFDPNHDEAKDYGGHEPL